MAPAALKKGNVSIIKEAILKNSFLFKMIFLKMKLFGEKLCQLNGVKHMEEEFLKYVSNIDASTFEQLVMNYWKDVWKYAFFMTKKYHMADDVTQEVFIKAFRNLSSFRGETDVKFWLLKITRNQALNEMRNSFFRRVTLVEYISNTGSSTSAEGSFLQWESVNDIWNLVMKLPNKYREVLILEAHFDLSVVEIARTLGISEGAVKSRIHRARVKMNNIKGGDTYAR
jgi:RNA polymerase sigma-70 factor (ECF subfamily)